MATILDKNRQIVFSNDALLKKMNLRIEDVIGKRPGEALNCVHSSNMQAGCGTSEYLPGLRCSQCHTEMPGIREKQPRMNAGSEYLDDEGQED